VFSESVPTFATVALVLFVVAPAGGAVMSLVYKGMIARCQRGW